jgi:hypothetical protein
MSAATRGLEMVHYGLCQGIKAFHHLAIDSITKHFHGIEHASAVSVHFCDVAVFRPASTWPPAGVQTAEAWRRRSSD